MIKNKDQKTADSFANSWNNLPLESVYTEDQVVDWFLPIKKENFKDREVLELGCGNASLLSHIASWNPKKVLGVDLGSSVDSAIKIMQDLKNKNAISDFEIIKSDLTTYIGEPKDVVYSIGVLHHLKNPKDGFDSILKNTKSGGRFHAWVYAHEGNGVIRWIVDPIRKVVSKMPWYITKYFVATPLVVPYFIYAKFLSFVNKFTNFLKFLPLYDYSLWIAKRDFLFFRHVAFDQLVTPQTIYIKKETIEEWLRDKNIIGGDSSYIIFRNGNSWKFGGIKK